LMDSCNDLLLIPSTERVATRFDMATGILFPVAVILWKFFLEIST